MKQEHVKTTSSSFPLTLPSTDSAVDINRVAALDNNISSVGTGSRTCRLLGGFAGLACLLACACICGVISHLGGASNRGKWGIHAVG